MYGAFVDGQVKTTAIARGLVDPSTSEAFAEVTDCTPELADQAVEAAHAAFGPWRSTSVRHRRDVLRRMAELIRRDQEKLATLESQNAGKPISAARGEVGAVAEVFDFYAGATDKLHGSTIPGNADGTLMTFREPLGVCVAIVPWNFPLVITSWKVAPALAMGNTVIVKPAGVTPLSALALAEIGNEAGLPGGVLNVLPGPGASLGDVLVSHRLVRKVSFTGSTTVGTQVMQTAANDITRVSLELGGKSANVIFGDADLDACIPSSLWSVFDNAGQDCCARSRFLVERSIASEVAERLAAAANAIVIGPTADDSTEMGPLITPDQQATVQRYIESATAEGARLLCGGHERNGPGNYLTPAVFADAAPDMTFMREEVFGPVVGIIAFDTEAEAIALANDSIYGLSGSIWTRDIGRALRVARAMETGMLSINSSSSAHIEAPFGGMKQSGLGREQGMVALEHYSELKTVFIARG